MPLAIVSRNPRKVDNKLLRKLVLNLPETIASALTCNNPEGKLTAQDVEVWVRNSNPHDANTKYDVEIVIFANMYEEREMNLDLRRKAIYLMIRTILPDKIKGFIWILLQPASFGEF